MTLTNQQIITEADILVPNAYTVTEKVPWLNALNQEFFDVVKPPTTERFVATAGTTTYTLTGNIKEKGIDKVMADNKKYRSLNYEDVQPTQNWFMFNDASKLLTLSSAPSRSGLTGVLRYAKSSTTTFTTGAVATQTPDAPGEYHWIIVLGLAEYIAKANEEDAKALDYGGQYRNALNTAALNYWKDESK